MKSVVPARSCRQAGDPWAFNRRRPRILLGAIVWKNDRAPIAATIVVDKPAHNVRAYDREGRFGRPATAAASRGNIALFRGRGNHVDLRGLPGGAEGIRTDGHRGHSERSRAILACR
jgi:hypothetical protein